MDTRTLRQMLPYILPQLPLMEQQRLAMDAYHLSLIEPQVRRDDLPQNQQAERIVKENE